MKESKFIKYLMISISFIFIFLMLIIPLITVIAGALQEGLDGYINAINTKETIKAIELTVLAVVISVFLNIIFGLGSAWLVTKFKFKGKNILTSIIDLPIAVSPIIAGMMFILAFG